MTDDFMEHSLLGLQQIEYSDNMTVNNRIKSQNV